MLATRAVDRTEQIGTRQAGGMAEVAAKRRGCVVAALAGWVALAGSYVVVRPFSGVATTATWWLVSACWVWVIGAPLLAVRRPTRRRAVAVGALIALGGTALWAFGVPQRTPEGLFRQHRDALVRLGADYRAGRMGTDPVLPWRLRFLSVDGMAHRRCGVTYKTSAAPECALFLLLWEDWRQENRGGIAYYPARPGPWPYSGITTAAGDNGAPIREIGDGWWLVE